MVVRVSQTSPPSAPPETPFSPAGAGVADPQAVAPMRGGRAQLWRIAAALTYRDFRVLWLGACTSSIGTWMQKVAQSWLVLELTDSAWYLALDSFVGEAPLLLFTLIGGVVADRQDRRKLLLVSQVVQMSSAFALALLVATGHVTIWFILALSFLSGCAQAFGGPAYQSLIPSLIRTEHLPNAVALNSIQFNIARVIGPLLAGAALHRFGMVSCFTLNGISFLVVIGSLLGLHIKHTPRVAGNRRMFDELKGGIVFVRDEKRLLGLTVLAFTMTFLAVPLLTFLPLIARNVFKEGVGQYSEMMAFSGVGAVAGALVVAWLGKFRHMGLTALLVQLIIGALIVAFALTRVLWVTHLLLLATGAAMIVSMSLVTSLAQLIAPNEMRGRVMSIYMLAFRGGMPLGSLMSGKIADMTSAPTALVINGILLICVAGYFLVRSHGVREV
jgi:MFS family permease